MRIAETRHQSTPLYSYGYPKPKLVPAAFDTGRVQHRLVSIAANAFRKASVKTSRPSCVKSESFFDVAREET